MANPEKILLTTWAHVKRISDKITNIRKSAFPFLFISFQINILFYFPQEFALFRFGWILSHSLRWSKAPEKALPNSESRLAKIVIITFPTRRKHALGGQEYHGKKTRWMESNIPIKPDQLQFVLGMDSGKVSGVDATEGTSAWGQNNSSVPARVWATVKMNSRVILVDLRCTDMDNTVHQFIFLFSVTFFFNKRPLRAP